MYYLYHVVFEGLVIHLWHVILFDVPVYTCTASVLCENSLSQWETTCYVSHHGWVGVQLLVP